MKSQVWLDKNYPQEERKRVEIIHLTEPNLEGELDLSEFTCWNLRVLISLAVDESKIKIKNQSKSTKIIKLVNAQDYIDQEYPIKESRKKVIELNISYKLEGNLDLSDFINLKELNCCHGKLITLNLDNCSQLKKIDCSNNQLTSLNVSNCLHLTELSCSNNLLTNLNLPTSFANLKTLSLNNNNLPSQDLLFLTTATNLKWLYLGNENQEKIKKDNYNRFTGSLEPLQNLSKLEELDISNTDINEVDVAKLPASLVRIWYSTEARPNCKLTNIVPLLKKYNEYGGWCQKCQQFNTSYRWCHPCQNREWQKDLGHLTGQEVVEKFIKKQSTNSRYKLQWIPYEQFTNIEYLAKGGFSKIYKAKREYNYSQIVVLKTLNNSQNITLDFLQEIVNTKLVDVDDYGEIVRCHGISQDPQTGNYLMVMEYQEEGNLRQYLKSKNRELSWENKLGRLNNITQGLISIHRQGLVHKDLHSGNIINGKGKSYITDLGLSRPTNSQSKESEIFGVLPYVAPEVLRGEQYTKASDIYSFGMIMYEMLTGLPPYYDVPHDNHLILNILKGLRPRFQVKIPRLLEDLIKQCWDSDPSKRPNIDELRTTFYYWSDEIRDKKDTEFTQQLQAAEAFNQTLPEAIRFPKYEIHQGACYHSKAINTQQITQLLTQSTITNLEDKLITLNLDEFTIPEEDNQTELETKIEIPPKK